MAKASSPQPRAVQFSMIEPRTPTQRLMPSAMVLRKRQESTTSPLEFAIHAPVLVCSTQTREMLEPVPKDSLKPSLASPSLRWFSLPMIAKSARWMLLPPPLKRIWWPVPSL